MSNLLKYEDSPYLQQHKDNPVDWYPWCDEAFLKAKEENKAIFISIGYSSCHWCHVMEQEVFENEEIAQKLNEDFICIKVDKEERPDIDKFYQELNMLLNQRPGGWPTSVFSTPENKPFFAGTYIPPYTKDDGVGFYELINIISEKVKSYDETLSSTADEIQAYLRPSIRPAKAAVLTDELISTFLAQAEMNFDKRFGGFGDKQKFPQVSTLKSIIHISLLTQNDTATHIYTHTLDNMIRGGMYDLVEGGFCRYSVEPTWLIPHFEKMAYDNGLLSELYLLAYKASTNKIYLSIAKETLDFMLTKMSKNHLFYSASDADSDGVEGKYYVYEYEEVIKALIEDGFSKEDAQRVCTHLHITPSGNFEGSCIVRSNQSKPDEYDKAISVLRKIRSKREYPFIDKKIITSWNAMVIKSLYICSQYDKTYLKHANKSLKALLDKLYINGHLYHTAMVDSSAKIDAFLEDYAYLSVALIEAYQVTLDKKHLLLAQAFTDKALELFYESGKWSFSKGEFVTDADIEDSTYAGSVGIMIDSLLSLGVLVDNKYRQIAFTSIEYYSQQLVRRPIHFPYFFDQAMRYIKEDRVIKGSKKNLNELNEKFLEITYPFILRTLSTKETILCGVQSCYTSLEVDSDLNKEVNKTLN